MTKEEFRLKCVACANTAHDLTHSETEPKSCNLFVEIDTQDIGNFIYMLEQEFSRLSVKLEIRNCGVMTAQVYYAVIYTAFRDVVGDISDGLNWAFI